jgi:hypothetical protein
LGYNSENSNLRIWDTKLHRSVTTRYLTFSKGFKAQVTAITVDLTISAKENGQIGPETVILDDFESETNSKATDSKAHSETDDSGDESDNPLDVISAPATPKQPARHPSRPDTPTPLYRP